MKVMIIKKFNLSVRDIDIIESALNDFLNDKDQQDNQQVVKEIRRVLGHIHNQKMWYRPNKKPYISG